MSTAFVAVRPGGTASAPAVATGAAPTRGVRERWVQERWVLACDYNDTSRPGEVVCAEALSCPVVGEARYRVHVRWVEPDGSPVGDGSWRLDRSVCAGPEAVPAVPGREVTVADVVAVARSYAPVPWVGSDPEGRTLVGVPTNLWALDAGTTVRLRVLGVPVPVTYRTTDVAWDLGDGDRTRGAGLPGAPVGHPDAVEHAYRRSGTVEVVATASYEVSFSLPGTGPVTVPGVVGAPGAPLVLQVGEAQTVVTGTGGSP